MNICWECIQSSDNIRCLSIQSGLCAKCFRHFLFFFAFHAFHAFQIQERFGCGFVTANASKESDKRQILNSIALPHAATKQLEMEADLSHQRHSEMQRCDGTDQKFQWNDSIDKKAMERFGPHYLEAKTCKTKVKKGLPCFWLHHSLLEWSNIHLYVYVYDTTWDVTINICTYQLGHHTCAFDNTCACFVTMHASSRQGRLNSDLSIIVVLRPITACIFHVEVARCTPSQRGTVVCCFAVTLRWVWSTSRPHTRGRTV